MFPGYGGVNPYPYQKNQTLSAHPNWGAFSPPMKEDQASTPHVQEAWAHNCGYPAPMPCHNCCIHSQHPSYYGFRPPYPHVPSPPPYGHCCGGYPAAYPQPYPYVPPPHRAMEVPRYGYEKSGFHCCECPNHTSHVKIANNNVKIEEQEPDVETKKGESLVPAGANGSPYPILWIPPEYMMNKEPSRRMAENEADEKCSSPLIEEPLMQPRIHQSQTGERGTPRAQMPNQNILTDEHNLLPLGMNNIRQLLGGAAKKPHDQEKRSGDDKIDDPSKQLSYPMIWWPCDGQGKDHVRGREERENGRTPSEDTYKVGNLEHPDKESAKERIAAGTGTKGSQRSGNVKIIPVKQLDDSAPKSLIKEQESKVKETVKNVGETAKQEPVRSGIRKSLSSTKKSKLPPICLRVDPPKKRNGSCISRSPSPDDKKFQYSVAESKREGKIENLHAGNQIQVQEAKEHDPIRNDVVVSHGTEEEKGSRTEEHKDGAEGKVVREPDSSKSCGTTSEDDRLHAPDPQRVQQTKHEDVVTPAKQTMSETEAAVIIQSAYRGYEVRRWEPLKKLRQIANVREEAGKIKRQIEKLESCSLVDNKEKLAIGETIMSLLIQLDSIQGLHTNIRDIRRSVAKELTTLQEKLDCIVSQKYIPTCPENASTEATQGQFEESGLDEGASGLFETVSDTSIPSCLNGSSDASMSAEYQMEGDSAKISDAGIEPQMGAPDKSRVAPEYFSMDSQDPLANVRPLGDSPAQFDLSIHDKDQKANLRVESRQEVVEEHFENEICRMDWECDLGAAKIPHSIEQEAAELAGLPAEIDDQVVNIITVGEKCRDTKTTFDIEKMEDKHVQSELHVEVIKEKEQVSGVKDAGTWNKDQEINLPNDTPEVECDDVVAIEHEQPTPAEVCDLDTDVPKPMETENLEQGSELQEHTAEEAHLVVPGIEVEKEVITEGGETSIAESAEGDGQPEKAASESLCDPQTSSGDHIILLPVSEGVMDAYITSSLLPESSVSVPASNNAEQIDEKITKENEMLRNMLEKLLASGKEQQDVISSLTMKVNDLEKKLRKQKKMRTAKRPGLAVSCKKVPSAFKRQRLMV